MRTIRPARRLLVTSAAGVLLLSSCGGGASSSWTFSGSGITELEESLETISQQWRADLTESGAKVTIPDDAGCYVQVTPEDAVTEEVLCGPSRVIGGETEWSSAPLSARTTQDGDVRLLVEEDEVFSPADANPNATPMAADGSEADLEAEVEEPAAPAAEVGEVISLADLGEVETAEPYELVTVDATYTIFDAAVTDVVGPPEDPHGAPEGGSLVTVKVERSSHDGAPTDPTSTAVLRAGGAEHEIPEGLSAIAVEGDGSDAVVAVDYGGNEQQYSPASGELVAGVPYIQRTLEPVNAPTEELIGNEGEGESTSYTFQVAASSTTWDEEDGWAAEGTERLSLDLSFDQSTSFRDADGFSRVDYREASYTVQALSVTADGEEVGLDPAAVTFAPKPDDDWDNRANLAQLTLDIPAGTQELVVSGSVSMTATPREDRTTEYIRDSVDGEPDSIEQTLELTPVTLTPADDSLGG